MTSFNALQLEYKHRSCMSRPIHGWPDDYTDATAVVKVVMCSRGGSASEVETHKNIDSVLHTKTTFQAHSIFSVSIQK